MSMLDRIAKAIVNNPIRAFHSSPHDFERFDISKVGRGEGSQVYGHGLYFAENPKVSGQGGTYWRQFLDRFSPNEMSAAQYLQNNNFNRAEAIKDAESSFDIHMKAAEKYPTLGAEHRRFAADD